MIKPNDGLIAIRRCGQNDFRSERVHWHTMKDGKSCEFYSKELTETIQQVLLPDSTEHQYCVSGIIISEEELAVFNIKNNHFKPKEN